jgi:hypothetical protein
VPLPGREQIRRKAGGPDVVQRPDDPGRLRRLVPFEALRASVRNSLLSLARSALVWVEGGCRAAAGAIAAHMTTVAADSSPAARRSMAGERVCFVMTGADYGSAGGDSRVRSHTCQKLGRLRPRACGSKAGIAQWAHLGELAAVLARGCAEVVSTTQRPAPLCRIPRLQRSNRSVAGEDFEPIAVATKCGRLGSGRSDTMTALARPTTSYTNPNKNSACRIVSIR